MNSALVGLWAFHRNEHPTEEEIILQILPDGRLAQFYKQHPDLTRHISMTLHATAEIEDTLRIRTTADGPGYLTTMHRDGPNLVIELNDHKTVARPLAAAEVPAWHAEALARAVWR